MTRDKAPLNVWAYWAGPRPWWIDACLDSMRRACADSRLRVLTPGTAEGELPAGTLPARWRDLPPGVGTDALRAALLATRGGLWLDADTVLLRDPAERFAGSGTFDYCVWATPPRRAVAGYCHSPAGHPVALRWLAGVRAALEHAENVGWGEIGEQLLTPAVQMCPSSCRELPLATFLPVDFDGRPEALFDRRDWREALAADTQAFGLNHSWMAANRAADLTPEAVASGSLLAQGLLRDAIQTR